MRRLIIAIAAFVTLVSCGGNANGDIVISEQNHENEAYDRSYELATRVVEATTYEEYQAAAEELRAYREAFRTQIGGQSYTIFLEESNLILGDI